MHVHCRFKEKKVMLSKKKLIKGYWCYLTFAYTESWGVIARWGYVARTKFVGDAI